MQVQLCKNKFYNVASGSWNLQRTESYGYDTNLDYLTSANYGDGLSNATPSWTYDAAGNRASDSTNSGTWSYDNLNRMTASPNTTYTNDTLGNRTGKTVSSTSTTYGWDDLNRMTSLASGGNTTSYAYRADGLRVSKAAAGSSSSQSSTKFRYDAQASVEDVELNSSAVVTAITRNALGMRGIDAVSRTTSSGTTVAYPLYDAHGNNVGMLTKSGSSWSLGDERTYDAWGQVRAGATTGTQTGRYCANLGHKQDDESGLIYMRARYYEPTSGRFVSEDPSRVGVNYYVYSTNDPVNQFDQSGKNPTFSQLFWRIIAGISAGLTAMFGAFVTIDGASAVGLGILSSVPGGMSVILGTSSAAMAGIAEGAMVVEAGVATAALGLPILATVLAVLAILAIVAGIMCLYDDTFQMNEAVGMGEHEQMGDPGS